MERLRFSRSAATVTNDRAVTPSWATVAWRLMLLLVVVVYAAAVYTIARSIDGGIGFSVGLAVRSAAWTLLALSLFVWIAWIIDAPRWYFEVVRPRRRMKKGCCPRCTYPAVDACPECGASFEELLKRPSRTHRTAYGVGVLLIGFALGVVSGEVWCGEGEAAMEFRVMPYTTPNFAAAPPSQPRSAEDLYFTFARPWPAHFLTVEWTIEGGFRAVDYFKKK
jgi:hypothetical protein